MLSFFLEVLFLLLEERGREKLNNDRLFFFQISRADQDCHTGQRFHEKFGTHADPGDSRLHVSCYISSWFDNYTRGRCRLYCLRHGG